MKNLFNITNLYIKANILSPSFKISAVVLAVFTIVSTVALSNVGDIRHTDIGFASVGEHEQLNKEITTHLNNLEGYTAIIYTSIEDLKTAIITGKIAGGFHISLEKEIRTANLSRTITAYFNTETPSTPFIKETITSVYLKALSYSTAVDYLKYKGMDNEENRKIILDDMKKTYEGDYLMEINIVRPKDTLHATQKSSTKSIILSALSSSMLIIAGVLSLWWREHISSIDKKVQILGFYISIFIGFFLLSVIISIGANSAEYLRILYANIFISIVATVLFFLFTFIKTGGVISISVVISIVSFVLSQSIISLSTYGLPLFPVYLSPSWYYLQFIGL